MYDTPFTSLLPATLGPKMPYSGRAQYMTDTVLFEIALRGLIGAVEFPAADVYRALQYLRARAYLILGTSTISLSVSQELHPFWSLHQKHLDRLRIANPKLPI